MSEFNKLAHAVWQCKYHLIWCSKYRFKILKKALQQSVKEILRQLWKWNKVDVLKINSHIQLSFFQIWNTVFLIC